ncbi:hypothetical protein Sango_1919500 [Sesamum angolense]|uniref:Reverse transcriptase RNase H-like domain-containing protein n=1 Tax=Sesamum angolense TaxID=2727404 RepID=A0AAE1WDM1_9LAMI|nr:hypothetical protein Sango_1919500 [Sesamum angolense]
MDLQPSQNNYSEEDRLQTSESLSGFFSRMTVSNKTMERIMRQDSNLSPYDGFRIGGIGEFAIPMEFTGNVMEMQLIPKEEILEELSRLREEIAERVYRNSRIFKEFAKDVLSEDRITGYKGKEKDLARVLTPQEIRQPVVGRYEGMLEIAGHEFLIAGVAGRENGSMTLGLSFLEDHKPCGRKGNGMEFSLDGGILHSKTWSFPKEKGNLTVIAGRDFSQKILILNTGIREAKIMIGGAFGMPWFRDKRKFGKVLLSFRQQGLIDSDSFYEESEEEIKNLKEAMQELKIMDISGESMLSLENVKRLIQRNFSEYPLAWWDRNKIEATLKIKEECKYKPIQMNMEDKKDMQIIIITLEIEPGISAYSSPGFFWYLSKDLANRKDFRLLKETESTKWKWEEIHPQRVRELKQVCNNLPKLAIPQDEDELVVYTYANDYRWAAVLMKGLYREEPCRYTGGLFTEQQAKVWHINEKEFFAVWKAFKKWPLFLLAKEFILKVDNTNVKAFLKNKLESKIEKAPNSVMLRLRHLRENLEELDREFGRLAVNAQVAGQVQRADLDIVQTNIRSSLVASTALWNALQEPIRKASPSVMTRELREQGSKPALRVQDSKPVAADSSTACTRPSPDSGEKATIESQGVQTSDDSSQPSASGIKEEEISLRPMTGTSKANTNELISLSSAWQDYQRKWEKISFSQRH